jgi:hypothetical protein
LAAAGGTAYFSDSSAMPLKKVAVATQAVTPLASRMSVSPDGAVIYGQSVYWRAGDSLYQSSLDGSATTVVASGLRDPSVDGFATDLAVDANSVYFVNPATGTNCSGPCPWMIESIPRTGGSPVVLASTTRRVVALASDAASIYWEEYSLEPVSTGCQCGSSINRVAKTGGTATQLVDGMLNAPPPNPGPGYLVGSWVPTGGITVDASQLYFAVSAYYGLPGYQVSSVPLAGGAVAALATVASSAQNAINTIRTVTLDHGVLYWIDMASGALYSVPATGGTPVSLAAVALTDMSHPSALAIAAGQAFWTEPGSYTGCCLTAGTGAIRSVPLSGGPTSLVHAGLDAPGWMTTDGTSLAWTEAWRVGAAPATGGAAHTAAAGISTNMPRVLIDAKFVYALDGDFIKKVPVGGGPLERAASARVNIGDFSVHDDDLISDGTNFYWTVTDMFSNSVVYTAPIGGGPTTLIGRPQGAMGSTITQCFGRVAVDTQYVYWISASATTAGGCSLQRAPLTGGTAVVLADAVDLRDFTVDGTQIYIANANSGIQAMPLGGGSAMLFASVGGSLVISDATNVYWLSGTSLWLQPKSGNAVSPTQVPGGVPVDPTQSVEALSGDQNGLYLTSTLTGTIFLVQ